VATEAVARLGWLEADGTTADRRLRRLPHETALGRSHDWWTVECVTACVAEASGSRHVRCARWARLRLRRRATARRADAREQVVYLSIAIADPLIAALRPRGFMVIGHALPQ